VNTLARRPIGHPDQCRPDRRAGPYGHWPVRSDSDRSGGRQRTHSRQRDGTARLPRVGQRRRWWADIAGATTCVAAPTPVQRAP